MRNNIFLVSLLLIIFGNTLLFADEGNITGSSNDLFSSDGKTYTDVVGIGQFVKHGNNLYIISNGENDIEVNFEDNAAYTLNKNYVNIDIDNGVNYGQSVIDKSIRLKRLSSAYDVNNGSEHVTNIVSNDGHLIYDGHNSNIRYYLMDLSNNHSGVYSGYDGGTQYYAIVSSSKFRQTGLEICEPQFVGFATTTGVNDYSLVSDEKQEEIKNSVVYIDVDNLGNYIGFDEGIYGLLDTYGKLNITEIVIPDYNFEDKFDTKLKKLFETAYPDYSDNYGYIISGCDKTSNMMTITFKPICTSIYSIKSEYTDYNGVTVGDNFNKDNVRVTYKLRNITGSNKLSYEPSDNSFKPERYDYWKNGLIDSVDDAIRGDYVILPVYDEETVSINCEVENEDLVKFNSTKVDNIGGNTFTVESFGNKSTFIVKGVQAIEELRAVYDGNPVLVGSIYNKDDVSVEARYVGETNFVRIPTADWKENSIVVSKEGINTYTATYRGMTAEYVVTGTSNQYDTVPDDDPIDGKTPLRLEVAYMDGNSEIEVGSVVEKSGFKVFAIYENEVAKRVNIENVKFNGLGITNVGVNTITATYKGTTGSTNIIGYKYAKITFDRNGAEGINDVKNIKIGDTYGNMPEPNRNGYKFGGWFTSKQFNSMITSRDYVTSDITLYANWNPIEYMVYLIPNGGKGQQQEMKCEYGTNYRIPSNTFTKTGFTFVGWGLNSNDTVATYKNNDTFRDLVVEENGTINLYALWDDGSGRIKPPSGSSYTNGGSSSNLNDYISAGGTKSKKSSKKSSGSRKNSVSENSLFGGTPKTGDNSFIGLALVTILICAVILFVLVSKRKGYNRVNNDKQ